MIVLYRFIVMVSVNRYSKTSRFIPVERWFSGFALVFDRLLKIYPPRYLPVVSINRYLPIGLMHFTRYRFHPSILNAPSGSHHRLIETRATAQFFIEKIKKKENVRFSFTRFVCIVLLLIRFVLFFVFFCISQSVSVFTLKHAVTAGVGGEGLRVGGVALSTSSTNRKHAHTHARARG